MDTVLPQPPRVIARGKRRAAGRRRPWLGALSTRSNRVLLLALAILVMSGVDLYLTLLYVTHAGMNEMNPLARAMMSYQSAGILALWKAGTVLVSVGILVVIRRQRSAEIGAWGACIVLGWLMGHWAAFIDQSLWMDLEVARAVGEQDPTWVMIDAGARVRPGRTLAD